MHYKQTILSITTCASVLLELSSSSSSQSSSQSSSGCCTKSAVWLLTAPAFHAAGCCCWYAGTCTAAEVGCQVWLGGGGGGIDGSLNEVICTQRIQTSSHFTFCQLQTYRIYTAWASYMLQLVVALAVVAPWTAFTITGPNQTYHHSRFIF